MAVPPPLPAPDGDKAALRRALRSRRRAFVDALDAATIDAAQAALADRVMARLDDATIISAYVAIGAEIDPLMILERAIAQGRVTALPSLAAADAPLLFRRWAPGDPLIEGALGTVGPTEEAEIVAPDLVLAPLLGFDRSGGRIGQGAGCYDRAFASLPAARRIGLAWSAQEVAAVPRDPWDVPLHGIATEKEWIG